MAKRVKVRAQERARRSESYLRTEAGVRARREKLRAVLPWVRKIVPPLALAAGLLLFAQTVRSLVESGPQFELAPGGEGLRITGVRFMDPEQIERQFMADFHRPLIDIPLEDRRKQILDLPWVQDAAVLRVWPNQVWVDVTEERPAAYVRLPSEDGASDRVKLLVRSGLFLEPPQDLQLNLPVVTGVTPEMPLPDRRRRIELLERLVADLDRDKPAYSHTLSEIDLSDAENAVVSTLHNGELVELQLGGRHFRHRYEIFLKYVSSWRREFQAVRTVDLRFKGLVAVR